MKNSKSLIKSIMLITLTTLTGFSSVSVANANDYYDALYPICKLDKGAKLQKGVYFVESGTEEQACWLNNGLMPVVNNQDYRDNSKFGFVNTKGKVVIPLTFDYVTGFNSGLAIVAKKVPNEGSYDYLYGAINTKGELVVPYQYKSLSRYSEGLISATNQAMKSGFIDATGKTMIDFKYDNAGDFINGLAVVSLYAEDLDNENNFVYTGVINKEGTLVIPMDYTDIGNFAYGVAYYSKDGKYGLINKTGRIILAPTYDEVSYMSKDLLAVSKNGKWGFINHQGKLVIPLIYDGVGESDEDPGWNDKGVISVLKGNKTLRINKQGNVLKTF